ncbi:MAG: 50S ribosomal protein L33 [Candidatus Hodgkinia cicadicola]|nr:MAG: 50S ribosomal protein L33 [Candidatus Hodgkinia cicadicola]
MFETPTKKKKGRKKTYKKVKLVSTSNTGYFYVVKKPTKSQSKLGFSKYDPIARAHCAFKETKLV